MEIEVTRRQVLAALGATMLDAGTVADRFADLRAYLEEERGSGAFPGCAVEASKRGRTVLRYCAGTYCALGDRQRAMRQDVVHPLFSFSKLVSATVIGIAVGEGLVDWDTPVRAWISDFRGDGKDGITIRHLLTHSAGIPNPAGLGPVRTPEEWRVGVQAVCAAKTEWAPGSRTAYHALSGQFVAAEAIVRRTGADSWAEYCRRKLFDPLRAPSLSFEAPPDARPVAITPQPKEMPGNHREAFGLAGHPAGGCFGTPADALKVLHVHLNRGRLGSRRLLPEGVWQEIHTVQYRAEIEAARRAGQAPAHEPWGLGPLLRGDGPAAPSLGWFGFANQPSAGVFGHAGIDTVIGVADTTTGIALFFVTTDSPKPPEKTVPLRNGVTDRVFAALA